MEIAKYGDSAIHVLLSTFTWTPVVIIIKSLGKALSGVFACLLKNILIFIRGGDVCVLGNTAPRVCDVMCVDMFFFLIKNKYVLL